MSSPMSAATTPQPSDKNLVAGIRPDRLAALAARAADDYRAARPRCFAADLGAGSPFLDAVPMHWMRDWPMPVPMLVAEATGATLTDIDGNRLDDFCLGDTGSMFGHSPAPVAEAIRAQAARGLTYMLPTEAAQRAGNLLSHVFGDFKWQIATTATDANRFALRAARAVTGRPKVLVFDGCYHGTVDDAMVTLEGGRTVSRPGLVGQITDLSTLASAAIFNDLASVEAALATGEIAAILTEPVMTNSCMVLPAPGFLEGLRDLATRYDALLIHDETHTISSGLGGYTRTHGLSPDIFVVGKCVAGGLPTAVWGLAPDVAERFLRAYRAKPAGHSGMGTTLSANPLQFAALEATLGQVMTPENYARMNAGAERLAAGLAAAIAAHDLPWHVVNVGARVEFICAPGPLNNGAEAAAAHRPDLERAIHLALVTRGCLIAPFHNMMLVSPVTSDAQIDRLIAAFDEILTELTQ
ncbi:aspartate aminotransferase family protein [uncultured Maritimibacter sp.]|jgi:glutamate-1-semialdehyde 2,1-aminomutase|uniref:aspartate aminotransferase family protein n=1 Tax=uncultured Maritimibacter sp. TaxID=991866 RepID=UPI000A87754B|nr:aspartate aminotransferase family protein [uncultured Maritimibacter sp.]